MTEENPIPEEPKIPEEDRIREEILHPVDSESEKAMQRHRSLSIFAIISLIAGIGTYVWFIAMIGSKPVIAFIVAPILALVAIISGHKARGQIKNYIGDMKGKPLANIGLILGYLLFLIGIVIVVLLVMGVSALAGLF